MKIDSEKNRKGQSSDIKECIKKARELGERCKELLDELRPESNLKVANAE
jgi:hypothetical protein